MTTLLKNALVGSVCLTAVSIAGSALAQDQNLNLQHNSISAADMAFNELVLAGRLGFYTGYNFYEEDQVDTDDTEVPLLGLIGAVSVPFSNTVSAQFDVSAELPLGIGSDDDSTTGELMGAVHLSYRDPSSHLIGVFGGAGAAWDNGDNDDPAIPFYFIGLEGQYYWDNFTLYGQGGFLDSDDSETETIEDAFFVRLKGSYYFSERTSLSLAGSYVYGDRPNSGNGDVSVYGFEAELKHQLTSIPATVFARYNNYFYDTSDESDAPHVNEFRIGLMFEFGADSLKSQERFGAGLDTPEFSRMIATSANEIE